jgi:hypothetical protein
VDVVSLSLEKANGDTVETLPLRQRVDFAELVGLTELVTAATIPNGTYGGASITLDYADADVTVELNGDPVEATVLDANGNALGVTTLDIRLDDANHVIIAPGQPSLLQLDFDLAASHQVDITTDPVTAFASPFVVATVLRVRGPLVSVNTNASSYIIDLRPFNHPSARLGMFTVETTFATAFEIDGVEYEGAVGLAQLAGKPAGTHTAAFGVLDLQDRSFTAEAVLAGDSVPGARFDVVRGDITVLIGPDTIVARDGGGRNLLRPGAISVGQRIHAFGEVTATPTVETLALDATEGRVRMNLTHLSGSVIAANPGLVALDLFAIDGCRPAIFDFAGTGVSPASDADPDNYEVATGSLGILGLTPDSPVRVFGFVTPFGFAPPDFVGRTVVDFSGIRAVLGVGWGGDGTTAPFLAMGPDGLVVDAENPDLGLRHHLKIRPRIWDITAFASPVTVAPATGRTLFALGEPGSVEVFAEWERFVERLTEKLNGGSTAQAMFASGAFDVGSTTLTANYLAVALKLP